MTCLNLHVGDRIGNVLPSFFVPEQARKSRAGSASPLSRQLIFFFPAREDSLPDFLQFLERGAHHIDILLVTVVHSIPEDIVEFIGVDTATLFHDPKFFIELAGQTKVALHRSFTALEQIDNSGQRTDTGRYASENSGGHAECVRCGLSFPVCLNGIDDLQGRAGDISCGGDDGSSGSPDGIADLIESADNVGQYAVKLRPGSRIGSFLFRLVLFFRQLLFGLAEFGPRNGDGITVIRRFALQVLQLFLSFDHQAFQLFDRGSDDPVGPGFEFRELACKLFREVVERFLFGLASESLGLRI